METTSITKVCKNMFVPCEDNEYRPSFLASKWFYISVAFLVLLKIVSIIISQGYLGATIQGEISRQDVYQLVNEARASAGLNVLKVNSKLEYATELKLADMRANGYFDHISPSGLTPWTWINKSEYAYSLAGENLAMNFFSSQDTFNAWMASPGHRKNILLSEFEDTGIAVGRASINGNDTLVVVQMFGRPKPVSVVSKVVPTVTAQTPKPVISNTPVATPVVSSKPVPVAKQNPIVPIYVDSKNDNNASLPIVLNETSYAADGLLREIMKWIFYASLIILALKLLVAFRIQFPGLVLKGAILVLLAYVLGFTDLANIKREAVIINNEAGYQELK